MEKRKVMLYLKDDDSRRLSSLAKQAGKSMNALVISLLWQADLPKRKAGEVTEYRCNRCGRLTFVDEVEALEPEVCPYPACDGLLVFTGRCLTLVTGRVE